MKLLNVRLSDEDDRTVRVLRARGVKISALVRTALRDELERQQRRKKKVDAAQILAELDAQHPLPADAPHHGIDTTDRLQVRALIRERLTRKKGR